jgi:hypothetical protein
MFDNIRIFFANCTDMEKVLRKNLYCLFLILMGASLLVCATSPATAQQLSPQADRDVSFPMNLNAQDVDFNLKITGKKKFKIVLDKKISANTKVKIYDILGNLIKEDKIVPDDGIEKSFDFSSVSSELFVVEVGNSKYNKTKSIYAQSPGTRKKIGEASE